MYLRNILVFLPALLAISSSFAQTYDPVAQFNTTGVQTSGAVWTYGLETSLNSGFSLLPSYQSNLGFGLRTPSYGLFGTKG